MKCDRCGGEVDVSDVVGGVILACYTKITPYTKKDQTTRIEGYVHGIGKRAT